MIELEPMQITPLVILGLTVVFSLVCVIFAIGAWATVASMTSSAEAELSGEKPSKKTKEKK